MKRDNTPFLFPKTTNDPFISGYQLGRFARILLGLMFVILVAGFCVAMSLEPNPRGFGTHQRLGLPPCSFRTWFGIPCPTCGMTTSFAHFVRCDFAGAFRAHTIGPFFATLCLGMVPWTGISAITGRLWKVETPDRVILTVVLVLSGALTIHWLIQVAI